MVQIFGENFDPGIWGTYSDWVIVFTSIVTVILLIWTLSSQIKVQKAQQDITRIENLKYSIEYLPLFSPSPFQITDDPTQDPELHPNYTFNRYVQVTFTNQSKNTARLVRINTTSDGWVRRDPPGEKDSFPPGMGFVALFIGKFQKGGAGNFDNLGSDCVMEIYFTDVRGQLYCQKIIYLNRPHLEVNMELFAPERADKRPGGF